MKYPRAIGSAICLIAFAGTFYIHFKGMNNVWIRQCKQFETNLHFMSQAGAMHRLDFPKTQPRHCATPQFDGCPHQSARMENASSP